MKSPGMLGFFLLAILRFSLADQWTAVDQVLLNGISNQVYPGCAAIVGDEKTTYYSKGFGNYTYGIPPPYVPAGYPAGSNPPVTTDTRWDLASVSKVIASTTVVAMLYDRGYLDLNTKISDPSLLGPNFAVNGKQDITVLNCMLHNAGYPPDPSPNYWDPAFGCPQTTQPQPAEDFSCRPKIYDSLLKQTLQYPTGSQYIYSDLSMITIMFATGTLIRNKGLVGTSDLNQACIAAGTGLDAAQCYFEAYLRVYAFEKIGMTKTGHLLDKSVWGECAPAENDTVIQAYQKILIQGQVSDGNAYALGGIAGHAGLFSTANDLALFFRTIIYTETLFTQKTLQYFIKEFNHTQSSRAIGWNTNDPTVTDQGWSLACGDKMSPLTWMHIGYTGTMVCVTPQSNYFTILLTNRIYPVDGSSSIQSVRRAFGDAVVNILGA